MVHRALALYGTSFLARGEGKVYVLDHCSFCVLFVTYFKLLGVLLSGLIRTPMPLNSPWDCLMFNLLSRISWLRFVMRNQINCQAVDECPAWLSPGSHKRSNQPNSKSETMVRQRLLQGGHNVEYMKQLFGWPDQPSTGHDDIRYITESMNLLYSLVEKCKYKELR